MVELAHARDGDEKAAADVEQGEREGFYRAAQIPELASLRQKESVEKNLENENCEKNADLERQVASERPARGSLELVAALKLVAFELQIAQMPAQAVQLVPALRRFSAEFAHGRGVQLAESSRTALRSRDYLSAACMCAARREVTRAPHSSLLRRAR